MAVFSLSDHVAKKAQEKFPTHSVVFDGEAFPEPIEVTFRNLIKLSKEERKRFNNVAAEVQKDIVKLQEEAKALDDAREKGEEVDPELVAKFERKIREMDAIDMKRALQVKQLTILATDAEAAEAAFEKCDSGQIEAITLLLIGNEDVEGLATGE